MGQVNPIPEKVVNYNVYLAGEKLTGIAGEVTLPSLEFMSETIGGAGIAGEFESSTPGHTGSITMEIPFRVIHDKSFLLLKPSGETIVLRASQQSYDVAAGEVKYRGLKITVKGTPKGHELGKIAVGSPSDSKVNLEVLYLKVEENGQTLLELDKLNFIYIVNGQDIFADIRNQI